MSADADVTRLSAPAKLTTTLRVTGVRADGYHLIDAEMVSLSLADSITFDPTGTELTIESTVTGLSVTADDDNLVAKALRLVGRTAGVHVVKNIPAGAGLGGGSSDAAAVLAWAGVDDLELAAGIGADVAFCVRGGRARVTGIGEVVARLPFVARTFTLLTPPFGVSTPAVYAKWDEMGGPSSPTGNDLEPAALLVAPELARWRDRFAAAVGSAPRLAGSGGTWFVDGAIEGVTVDGVRAVVATTVPGRP